jgi:diacylglycerol kinase family enzyme
LKDLVKEVRENDKQTRKIVVIMGGDGSFGTTIKFLRTSKEMNNALTRGQICFAVLPFGTGNDGPQTFGWGDDPQSEMWFSDVESLMRDLISSNVTNLSLWNCQVDGKVLSPSGEELPNNILMTYYFNLGLDPKISLEVERKRTGNKCCNKLVYIFVGMKNYFWGEHTDARQQVKRVVSTKTLPNGLKQDKVVTDMNELTGRPLNVVGYNLNSGYGNFVHNHTW